MTRSGTMTPRRSLVWDAVRTAANPVSVDELAELLSMHRNTVWFHLDALEGNGEVERVGTKPSGRGRPRVRYRAIPGALRGERRYQMLAEILVVGLEGAERGRERAEKAGFAWGEAHAKGAPLRGGDPVDELVELMAEEGFSPVRTDVAAVELWNCPFQEAAVQHGPLICGIHDGLMRGALDGWGASVEVRALEPFVEPGVCRVSLDSRNTGTRR